MQADRENSTKEIIQRILEDSDISKNPLRVQDIKIRRIDHKAQLGKLDKRLSSISVSNSFVVEVKKFGIAFLATLIILAYISLTGSGSAYGNERESNDDQTPFPSSLQVSTTDSQIQQTITTITSNLVETPPPEPAPKSPLKAEEPQTANQELSTCPEQDTSPYCEFVKNKGGGESVAPGVIYQNNGIEHIVFVNLNNVDKTLATSKETGFQSTSDFANKNDLTVAINGNWFSSNQTIDGFVVSNGNVYGGNMNQETGQSGDHDYTAMFGFTPSNKIITAWHGEEFSQPPAEIYNAVSGHPSLTHKGKLSSEFGFKLGSDSEDVYTLVTPNAHSAIGVSRGKGVLIFAAVDGKKGTGYSALQVAQMMQRVGAYESVMLDGSGSTSLVINGKEVTSSNDGRLVLANIGIRTSN